MNKAMKKMVASARRLKYLSAMVRANSGTQTARPSGAKPNKKAALL